MNSTIKSLLTLTALGAMALGLSAQPALKVATVDMSKLLEGYYKTEDQMNKLKATQAKAEEQLEAMGKEINQMYEQYKDVVDQAKNTLLTADARAKAEADKGKLEEDITKKQQAAQGFRNQTVQTLQGQWNSVRAQLLDEIGRRVTDLAKSKGATFVVDRTGPSILGVPSVIYSDTAYDLTDEVLTDLNKDKPATPAVAAPAAPAAAAPAPAAATPSVTVPGLAPKK